MARGGSSINNLSQSKSNVGVSGSVSIGSSGGHSHSVGVTISSQGSGTAHENRPPYFVLAYIMKL